jgi:D-inositol-3-phosphate glycosyltransferase
MRNAPGAVGDLSLLRRPGHLDCRPQDRRPRLPTTVKPPFLRIAMISEHASPLALAGGVDAGGQNVYVAHVARCLAAAGHQVDVLTRRDTSAQPAAVSVRSGMRVFHLSAGPPHFVPKEELLAHMPEFTDSAIRLFAGSAPYDVIHANFFMSGQVGLALRERFGVPLVVSFHALGLVRREHQREADHFPPQRIDIEQRLARQSDRVIAACPQDQADLLRLYGTDPKRVVRVPCGVDTHLLRPGDRRRARSLLRLPDDEFVVLQLGRMVPRKGIDNVVRALALCQPGKHGRSRLDRRRRIRCTRRAADTGNRPAAPTCATARRGRARAVSGPTSASGFAHAVPGGRRLVTTPGYEPFGITPLEAMACGTPVIGSAVGGIKLTVLHGVTGYLVPANDPTALAARLLQLQSQPALAEAMGRAGVRRVRSLQAPALAAPKRRNASLRAGPSATHR